MKSNIFRPLALCTLAVMALTLTGCSKDELATDLTTNGGNGPIRIAAIGIEGAAETRAAITEGTFAGSANPGPNEVKTAFAVGDMVYLQTTDNDGTKYPTDESLTATLQADGSWAMTNEALRPATGKTWESVRLEHYPEVNDVTTDIPADPGSKTPTMTRYHDELIADNDVTESLGIATIVNGAITAKMIHNHALLTIAPSSITIGGEFAKDGYTTIATLRASMDGVTDADDRASARFPFTPMGEPIAEANGNHLWQAISPFTNTSNNTGRITSLHIRLARPDGSTSDEMEIAVKPLSTGATGTPGLTLERNHRYKLKISLYNAEAMKVEVPAEYPSWGEEEEIKNNIFFIKDAEDLKTFTTAVNVGNTTAKGVVTADFEFDPTTGGSTWTGIGYNNPYTGTFDGQGHTITFTNTDAVNYGLFSEVGTNGTVKNITVSGANVDSNDSDVGAIVNYNNDGTITACYATDCTIDSHGEMKSGGVVGRNKGILTACSAMNCTTSSLFGGGVVGRNDNITTACIAIGCNPNKVVASGTTTASYAVATAADITADNIAGMNTALAAITPATNYRWIKDDKGTPKVIEVNASIATYFLIYDAASLWKFHNIVNGLNSETLNAYLKAMVMTNFEFDPTTTGAWKGIGEYNYSGIFDGGGHTITFTKASDFGLFGTVKGRAKNITVKNCNTTAIGAIADTNTGTLENCHAVSCTISGTSDSYDTAGGVVGVNYGKVYACSATDCKVKGSESIGAVIGHYEDTVNESGNPIPNAVIGCIGINCTNGNDESPLNTIVGSSRSDYGSITITASYAAPTAAGINSNDPNGAVTDMNTALATISNFAWQWKYDSSATPAWSIIPKQ